MFDGCFARHAVWKKWGVPGAKTLSAAFSVPLVLRYGVVGSGKATLLQFPCFSSCHPGLSSTLLRWCCSSRAVFFRCVWFPFACLLACFSFCFLFGGLFRISPRFFCFFVCYCFLGPGCGSMPSWFSTSFGNLGSRV